MFVKFQVGDKVAVLDSNGKKENGTVLSVKKTECVVQIEGNDTPQNVHKTKLVKLWGKSEEEADNSELTLEGAYEEVRKFQKAMEQPYLNSPQAMSKERRIKRTGWLKEEGYDEFLEADELVDQVDALTDALYIILGSFNEIGVKPTVPFKIVQNANMHKLNPETGKPMHNKQGKVVKPEGWHENFAPEKHLQVEIDRQIKEAEKHV